MTTSDETDEQLEGEIAAEEDAGGEPDEEGEEELTGGLGEIVEPEPYVVLRYVDVAMVLPSTNPVLVLEEEGPPYRQLRIPIGTPEGMAIAYAARGVATKKPLTHELMTDLLEAFSLTVDALRITEVSGSAYGAELACSGPTGARTLPCRPSDGVALALRQRIVPPILAAPEVLDQAGEAPEGS